MNAGWAMSNLAALIVSGLSVSWWVLYHTDLFPVVGGLLGLGGFFAWIAFVINILSDTRKKQIQDCFDKHFLQQRWLCLLLAGLLVIGWLILAPNRGTLLVDSLETMASHLVKVSDIHEGMPVTDTPVQRVVLAPRSSAKILLPTSWFGSRKYHVKISGLPARSVTVSGLRRQSLLVPDMLIERPVLLARPSAKLSGPVSDGFSLQVLFDGEEIGVIDEYKGEAVWIGADDDVKVPEELVAEWRLEFTGLDSKGLNRWLRPVALASTLDIPPSTKVTVNLLRREDQTVIYSKALYISKSGKARRFPEEVVLDVP